MRPDSPANRRGPRMIGRYELIKKIGAGGMGTVYKARHLDLGREVALKILPAQLADMPEMLERFHQEAKNAAKLRHEHIVTLYEINKADGIHFLAMEYVEGKNLHEYIEEKRQLEPEEARKLMIQAARALALAHNEGIIHRDIKPSNFLLAQKGGKLFVKLTDFGLARSMDDSEFKVTRSGTTVGTVDYIAPEQARSSRAADIRSDIYSLGCTFYHMLAGRVPFPEGDMTERLLKHVEATPEDVRRFNPEVPPGMVVVLNRMLAKRPDDRYQTPMELLKDLEHLPAGPALSPRELLEALALDSTAKPKTAPRTASDARDSPADSSRLLGRPLLPGEVSKLRYRHLQLRKRKAKDLENAGGGRWTPLSIQGWKAWLCVAGAAVVVVGISLAFSFGWLRKTPDQAPRLRPEAAGEGRTAPDGPNAKELGKTLLEPDAIEEAAAIPPGKQADLPDRKKVVRGQPKSPDKRSEARVTPVQPKWSSPPVYQPPPEQIAMLQKQFQSGSSIAAAERMRAQPAPQTSVNVPTTPPLPKPTGSEIRPPADSGQKTPLQPPISPKRTTATYYVSRWPLEKDGTHFESLKAACAALRSEDESVIEIHDNGPIFEGPVTLTGRTVTIRAGKGYQPLIVCDIQALSLSRSSQFFWLKGAKVTLENLSFALKISSLSQDERVSVIRMEGGLLDADNCTFSVAGRNRTGASVARIDPARNEIPPGKCRLAHCFVRGAEVAALDVRAPGAEVVLDGCLLVSTNRPVVEVVGKAGAATTVVRAAHSTLVGGQALFRIRPLSSADRQPAVHWLLWDSLLGHCGDAGGGALLDLEDGIATGGMQWRAINCLYSGWSTLLRGQTENIYQNQFEVWRRLWNNSEGDRMAAETWPAVVPPDPSETPAAAFRVVGTHAAFSDSTKSGTLGCDVSVLPPARDNWLSISYERVVPSLVDLPAADQPPAVPDPGDARYHGEQLDLNTINLGDYLRDIGQKRQFGPRVVLRLRGKGEVRTAPIYIKGSNLVLYFEPPEEGEERLVLVPKNAADRAALIEVEGGGCEIIGGKIRFPNRRGLPVPQHLVKVQGGHLYVIGCHLEGPLGQAPASFRGLVLFEGSGEAAPDQVQECVLADSVCLSGRNCVHEVGAGARVRAHNCVFVAGSEAFYLEPGAGATGRLNAQCILEKTTITAQHALFRVGDASSLSSPIEPLVVQARSNLFLDVFAGPQRRCCLFTFEAGALAHGLVTWQGEANVYDKQLQYYVTAQDQPLPSTPQSYSVWARLWGATGDRRALFVDPSYRSLDLDNLQLDRLVLPELFRSRLRGQIPGADLEQLGIVKKSKKK